MHLQPEITLAQIIIRYIRTPHPFAHYFQVFQRLTYILQFEQQIHYLPVQCKQLLGGVLLHCFQMRSDGRIRLPHRLIDISLPFVGKAAFPQTQPDGFLDVMKGRILLIQSPFGLILIAVPSGRIFRQQGIRPQDVQQGIHLPELIQTVVGIHYFQQPTVESPLMPHGVVFLEYTNDGIHLILLHRHQIAKRRPHAEIVIVEPFVRGH